MHLAHLPILVLESIQIIDACQRGPNVQPREMSDCEYIWTYEGRMNLYYAQESRNLWELE